MRTVRPVLRVHLRWRRGLLKYQFRVGNPFLTDRHTRRVGYWHRGMSRRGERAYCNDQETSAELLRLTGNSIELRQEIPQLLPHLREFHLSTPSVPSKGIGTNDSCQPENCRPVPFSGPIYQPCAKLCIAPGHMTRCSLTFLATRKLRP